MKQHDGVVLIGAEGERRVLTEQVTCSRSLVMNTLHHIVNPTHLPVVLLQLLSLNPHHWIIAT